MIRRSYFLRWFALSLALMCSVSAASAQTCPTNYAHVTALKLGARTPLASGLLTVTAIGADQQPINYSVPGLGIELTIPKHVPIASGALTQTLCLPRSDRTSVPVGYHFQIRDYSAAGGGRIVLDATAIAITTDEWSFDDYDFNSGVDPWSLSTTVQVPVSSIANQVLITTAPGVMAWTSFPSCTASSQKLSYNTSTHLFSCDTLTGGGGGGGGGGSTPGLLVDDVTSQYYSLTVTSGSLFDTAVSSTGTPSTGIELIDTVTSTHYTLYSMSGSLYTVLTSSPGVGVSSYSFVDTVTSTTHTLTITSGGLFVS